MINTEIILEKINEVYIKTSKITIEQQLELSEAFSCKAKDFFFHPKFKSGHWSGDLFYYNRNTGLFPIGLLPYFINFCKKFNYNYQFTFDVSDLNCDISDEEIDKFFVKVFQKSLKPRQYQDFAIRKALRSKRGIIEQATGSGKSLNIYALIRFILIISDKKILLIVPSINLVEQMFKDFKDYGFTSPEAYTGLIYGTSKMKFFDKQIIISTYQSIYKKEQSFFEDFKMVIVDEVHQAKAVSIRNILEKCVNADYRIGLTGSLQDVTKKNERADFLTIIGFLGPVIAKETASDLIDKGFLSKIVIANLILKYEKEYIELTKFESFNYSQEVEIIQSHRKRNKILDFILNNIDKSHNILILCHEVNEHLKIVEEYLKENQKNWKLHIIHGQTKVDKRESIRHEMIAGGGNILLASYGTLSTGVNLPRLHEVVFFSSYKSKIKILQSIGRGLRKHESKDKVCIFDIVDDLTYTTVRAGKRTFHKNYVYKHWLERLQLYKQQGFKFFNKQFELEKL